MTRVAQRGVVVQAGEVALQGDLRAPEDAKGVVLFAHGSGSSRHSPRNRFVAEGLNAAGMATLLVDLLSEDEERQEAFTRHLRFDIGLLAERLTGQVAWLASDEQTRDLPLGLFGASTGAAAALVAASRRSDTVRAVVSRGGRPDLAGDALERVRAPTLLIVGERDQQVLELNREAERRLRARTDVRIVPGATHLFEEEGALAQVVDLARDWFLEHVPGG